MSIFFYGYSHLHCLFTTYVQHLRSTHDLKTLPTYKYRKIVKYIKTRWKRETKFAYRWQGGDMWTPLKIKSRNIENIVTMIRAKLYPYFSFGQRQAKLIWTRLDLCCCLSRGTRNRLFLWSCYPGSNMSRFLYFYAITWLKVSYSSKATSAWPSSAGGKEHSLVANDDHEPCA